MKKQQKKSKEITAPVYMMNRELSWLKFNERVLNEAGNPRHNLYDIFYGRFRKNETEILKSYIEEAPRDTFKDILDAIDRFVYFENRKK